MNPVFAYGDRLRHKKTGREVTVRYIYGGAYHFTDGTFALIADQDCYEVAEKASGFFLVASGLRGAPLDDHLEHGYEDRQSFEDALVKLLHLWRGRIGENIANRNGFLLLRFRDIPGGGHEDAWLPEYLLKPCPPPDYAIRRDPTPEELIIAELDKAFGFD